VRQWALAARRGAHAEAMAGVARLEGRQDLGGTQAYDLACVAALASAAARSDSQLAEEYARRAMALLARAEQGGFFRQAGAWKHARSNYPDLECLRQRSDFREWMDRLKKAAPAAPAEAKPR
jgi:hypothetical protein